MIFYDPTVDSALIISLLIFYAVSPIFPNCTLIEPVIALLFIQSAAHKFQIRQITLSSIITPRDLLYIACNNNSKMATVVTVVTVIATCSHCKCTWMLETL